MNNELFRIQNGIAQYFHSVVLYNPLINSHYFFVLVITITTKPVQGSYLVFPNYTNQNISSAVTDKSSQIRLSKDTLRTKTGGIYDTLHTCNSYTQRIT